jgi:hypothetical protein
VDGGKVILNKTAEQLFQERAKRIEDAIQLKVPDRVPTTISLGYFPAKYAGVTCADAFYKPAIWKQAAIKTIIGLQPDACNAVGPMSGAALDALDFKQMLWPGGPGASPYHTHQFVEGEYMKADEYDAFLEDPSDYLIRTYLPRVSGALESFKKLPHMSILLFGPTTILGLPGLDTTVAALSKARHEILHYNAEMESIDQEIERLGFPTLSRAATFTPFDIISDRLRGMRGSMLDMYRQPAKLLKTCEKLLPLMLNGAIARAKATGNLKVFIPLHRGAEGFMSLKQFETFYWPTFKALLLGLIDAGLTPMPFFEGDYTSRLEYLSELPVGKIVGHFDNSDIKKVKEAVGNIMCIMGNVPSSLLQTGTQQDVKDYCKKLIDDVSPGGGFILAPRSAIDEAKPENIKAMIDFTREYGVYK